MLPLLLVFTNASYCTQLLREGGDGTLCAFYTLLLSWKYFPRTLSGKTNSVAYADRVEVCLSVTHARVFHHTRFNSSDSLGLLFLQHLPLSKCKTLVCQHRHSVLAPAVSATICLFLLDQLLPLSKVGWPKSSALPPLLQVKKVVPGKCTMW